MGFRCPNCKKDFGKDRVALSVHAKDNALCGAKIVSGIVEILRIEHGKPLNAKKEDEK